MFVTFIASLLVWVMISSLAVLWLVDGKINKEQALHAFFAALVAWAICEMVKTIYPTVRPFVVEGIMPATITVPLDSAFPSAHTAISFAIAVTIFLHDKKLGALFLFAAFFVGVGRILANLHYPLDVIGGAVIGATTSLVSEKLHLFSLTK